MMGKVSRWEKGGYCRRVERGKVLKGRIEIDGDSFKGIVGYFRNREKWC